MGAYVNPNGMSKEFWLAKNGFLFEDWKPGDEVPPFETFTEKGDLPVILVDNGMFTAAGIGFDEREYKMMTDCTTDKRDKQLFSVPKTELLKVSDELKKYLRE